MRESLPRSHIDVDNSLSMMAFSMFRLALDCIEVCGIVAAALYILTDSLRLTKFPCLIFNCTT